MTRLIPLIALVALVGCQDSVVGPQAESSATAVTANAHGGDAFYRAVLRPLNADENGRGVTGKARIVVDGSTISVSLDARNLAPGIPHAQHIHAANACPTMGDDANGDGVLDVIEGAPVYGLILVPLDSDLSAQAPGTFPVASARGMLDYDASALVGDLIADLQAPDPNPDDVVIKLEEGENLNLEGRHIVVHGVASSTPLPSTVASIGTLPSQATLPVACGEIRLVKK